MVKGELCKNLDLHSVPTHSREVSMTEKLLCDQKGSAKRERLWAVSELRRAFCAGPVPLEAGPAGQIDILGAIRWQNGGLYPGWEVQAREEVGFPGLAGWEVKFQDRWRDLR